MYIIVYLIFVDHDHWKPTIEGQLEDLSLAHLPSETQIHIAYEWDPTVSQPS